MGVFHFEGEDAGLVWVFVGVAGSVPVRLVLVLFAFLLELSVFTSSSTS